MTLIPGIKQISQVGNDMYAQGAITIAGIGTTNVDYLADPADTRLLAGRDPVLEEVSVGISGVETDQKYATGPQPLTVTDAMQGNLTYCEVQFSPKQDLHGYDSPWPAGGGVNKFGPNESPTAEAYIKSTGDVATGSTATNWIISDYIPVLAETQYTFKPNSTSGLVAYFAYYDTTKTLISTIVSSTTTFTTPADCAFMRFSYRDSSYDIQLELGSSVSATYAPYSNLCPITGTDTVNVYVAESYDPAAAPEATVSLGAERYGGTADIVSGNGSKEWMLINANDVAWSNTGAEGIYCTLSDKVMATGTAISDTFQARTYSSSNRVGWTDAMPTRSEKLAIIAAGDVHILYNLNIPTPYTFPGANDITLQDGTNTIWADTNGTDISVTYVTKK